MPGRALQVLEFGRVLEFVAGFASTTAGREMVRRLRPSADPDALRARLDAVAETVRFLEPRSDWALPAVPDARTTVARLGVEGSVLPAAGLSRLGGLLAAGHALDRVLAEGAVGLPRAGGIARPFVVAPPAAGLD